MGATYLEGVIRVPVGRSGPRLSAVAGRRDPGCRRYCVSPTRAPTSGCSAAGPRRLICVQWALAAADGRNEPLAWICDVSFERYPEISHQIAGRVDSIVARRMRSIELLLVLDVATTSNWSIEDVRLVVPNDKGMWSLWP